MEEYSVIPTVQERLSAVVARVSRRHTLTAEEREKTERVPGCVSAVWIIGSVDQARCSFRCEADSPMVKGLVALLCDFYSNETVLDVAAHEPRLIQELGFDRTLTPTRLNGLDAVQRWIRNFAQRASSF